MTATISQLNSYQLFAHDSEAALKWLICQAHIPASSKICCLNPKVFCIGTPYLLIKRTPLPDSDMLTMLTIH